MGFHMPKQYPVKDEDLSVKPAVFAGISMLVLVLVTPEYGFEVLPIWFGCMLAAYQLPW